jgi:methionyl-tRNA formyltransferase
MIAKTPILMEHRCITKRTATGIKIQTGKGILIIQTLQPEGKKPMKSLDFAMDAEYKWREI